MPRPAGASRTRGRRPATGSRNCPASRRRRATPEDWFAVTEPSTPPVVCKTLGGPWGEDLDPGRAALPRHEALKVESETVLLEGDGLPLAIAVAPDQRQPGPGGGQRIVPAQCAPCSTGPAGRWRSGWSDWVGDAASTGGVRRGGLGARRPAGPALGLRAAEGLAVRLGGGADAGARAGRLPGARARGWAGPGPSPPPTRTAPPPTPRPWAPSWRRTRQAADARAILDAYRRWRYPSAADRAERRRRSSPRLVPSVSSPAGPLGVPRASCDNHSSESPESPAHE